MTDDAKFTDEKLIELIRHQNKELYGQIIKRYGDKLLRYAHYLVNDEQKAADIVQQSFIKSYVNLQGFDTKKKFSSWIYRIVHNQAINEINSQEKQISLSKDIDYDSGIDIQDEYIKKELAKHVHTCLNQMPVIYKEPLSLYYLEEKSYEEIGDILRIPMGTVGIRIKRAKVLMKKICQQN